MRHYIFILAVLLIFPAVAYAGLININTADEATLETLTGIGPTKGAAIISYRTAHGPFAQISDIQNVSGIGPSTYAGIQAFITVGDSGSSGSSVATTTTTTSTATSSSSGSSTWVPTPSALTVDAGTDQTAFTQVPLHLGAVATVKGGAVDTNASISWTFGDGSTGFGTAVDKTYRYAGKYLVRVTATDGATIGHDELTVTVVPAKISISAISNDGITILNQNEMRLDLSGWRLSTDTGSFKFPEGTVLMPESEVLFPFAITNLSPTTVATLTYPNGTIASQYAPVVTTVSAQPSTTIASSSLVQAEPEMPAPVTSVLVPSNATPEIIAPAEATLTAAAGASVPGAGKGMFRSPWMLGFLGFLGISAGALMIL